MESWATTPACSITKYQTEYCTNQSDDSPGINRVSISSLKTESLRILFLQCASSVVSGFFTEINEAGGGGGSIRPEDAMVVFVAGLMEKIFPNRTCCIT